MLRLTWESRLLPGEACRVVAVACDRGSPLAYHAHDFPEIFWLDEGACLHAVNGREERLETGELVAIRPGDAHALTAIGRRRFTMLNVEIRPDVTELLRERFPDAYAVLFDDAADRPRRLPLADPADARRLAVELSDGPPSAFRAAAFLFDLVRRLAPPARPSLPPGLPDWLEEALIELRQRECFAEGVPAFVRRAGRSHEHVARVCRRCLGRTPAQLVNERRMDYAARELRLSTRSILEIALDCGFGTTAQFYKLFRARHGLAPLAYRRRQHDPAAATQPAAGGRPGSAVRGVRRPGAVERGRRRSPATPANRAGASRRPRACSPGRDDGASAGGRRRRPAGRRG